MTKLLFHIKEVQLLFGWTDSGCVGFILRFWMLWSMWFKLGSPFVIFFFFEYILTHKQSNIETYLAEFWIKTFCWPTAVVLFWLKGVLICAHYLFVSSLMNAEWFHPGDLMSVLFYFCVFAFAILSPPFFLYLRSVAISYNLFL